MIINNAAFDTSLNNTAKLKELIVHNPELPLIIFCGEDCWQGDYNYNMAYAREPSIEVLTLYGDMWLPEEDVEDELSDDLSSEPEYESLSDEEYSKMIKQKVAEMEACKAIVIYVD